PPEGSPASPPSPASPASPAFPASPASGAATAIAADAALYAFLTLLVWGLTAPLCGLWQDDAALLGIALARRGQGWAGVFAPTGSPLRRLYELPFFLAQATPHPVRALQLLYGALWMGNALAAGWIAGLLIPRRPLTRLLVIALTLTATSDYLTDNLTAMGYQFAVLMLLLAIGSGLRFLQGGGAGWLPAAAAALAASLWTIDVAIPALVFLPFLVAWQAGVRPRSRSVALLLAWGAVAAPVALLEWRFLHDPTSYAAVALRPVPPGELASRAMTLWSENFMPWQWAFARKLWYLRPPVAIPAAAMALAAALAVAALALRLRRMPPEPPPAPAARVLGLAALLALMALAANAAYANVQLSDIRYRTHVMSRIWVSLALGILAGWAAARWPRARLGVLAVPALFVGLGTWGGLERQDLFLATWRQHRRELLSIATSAPALRPGTRVILRSGDRPPIYLATQVEYLTISWLRLLYEEPHIHGLRLGPQLDTGCRPGPRGLDCWHAGKGDCFAARTCAPDHYDYDRTILMDYDAPAGVYRLRASLAGDPLAAGAAAAAAAYRPEERIIRRPLSTAQRRLLLLE
ncbi:MAG TPA: hypothetical protein VOA80_15975, partial [Thermoanaerobaculia bacterium]|nr:hypothetical protein [Thermoanaerobaculia bacterium]